MLRRPGSSWGFGALLKGTSLWYWGWKERCTFTPPTANSCWPETRTHNLWITSQLSNHLATKRDMHCFCPANLLRSLLRHSDIHTSDILSEHINPPQWISLEVQHQLSVTVWLQSRGKTSSQLLHYSITLTGYTAIDKWTSLVYSIQRCLLHSEYSNLHVCKICTQINSYHIFHKKNCQM